MLEDDVVLCPVCQKNLSVKFIMQKKITYIVPNDCPYCKTSADKLENMLNRNTSRVRIQTERSYMKLDPRG